LMALDADEAAFLRLVQQGGDGDFSSRLDGAEAAQKLFQKRILVTV